MDSIKEMLMESFFNENGRLPTKEELESAYIQFCNEIEEIKEGAAS